MMTSGKFARPCNSLAWFLVVVLIQLGLPRSAKGQCHVPDEGGKGYTKYTCPPDYTGLFKSPPLSTGDKVFLGAAAVGGVAALVYYVSKRNAAVARARLSPANLNFGRVPIGDSRNYVVELANDGAAPFQVVDVRFSGEAFSLAQPLELPHLIEAPGRRRIGINFGPGSSGTFSGTMEVLVVEVGKRKAKTLKVLMRGKAVAPLGAWANEGIRLYEAALATRPRR